MPYGVFLAWNKGEWCGRLAKEYEEFIDKLYDLYIFKQSKKSLVAKQDNEGVNLDKVTKKKTSGRGGDQAIKKDKS